MGYPEQLRLTQLTMRHTLVMVFIVQCLQLHGQSTFDIIHFNAPEDWKNETADFATSYVNTNPHSRNWCRISIYKSIQSSGEATADFKSEWQNLVTKTQPDAILPTEIDISTKSGWQIRMGSSEFLFDGFTSEVSLTTFSGFGKEVSVLVMKKGHEFDAVINRTIASINLDAPEPSNLPATPPATTTTQPVASGHGISISTTRFDDGWTAVPQDDYVEITKGSIRVLLHYAIEITDAMRNTGNIEGSLFDQVIGPRYQVSDLRKYDNGGTCYICIYFYEANVTDKKTGQSYYLGFRAIINSGVARCIEITAPSQSQFQQELPSQEKIESLLGYNKFAVQESDLVGTWKESSGASANMYNVYTGAYAGMSTATSASEFIFLGHGRYESSHKGASGMVGNMNFYSQHYTGEATIGQWEITLTKRFEGRTENFFAQFEAVRGGRILRLTNKKYSGDRYALVKTN